MFIIILVLAGFTSGCEKKTNPDKKPEKNLPPVPQNSKAYTVVRVRMAYQHLQIPS
jgi:hypothetical protein